MLRFRSFGKERPALLGGVRLSLLAFMSAPVANQEKSQYAAANQPGQ
jgi:hypothetical protein